MKQGIGQPVKRREIGSTEESLGRAACIRVDGAHSRQDVAQEGRKSPSCSSNEIQAEGRSTESSH